MSGTQTVTVRWAKKTLELNVTPIATKYEGDSVTFTARSTDNRPVAVSNWYWRDTTGTSTVVPCGYSPVCRWVPPNAGIMYVRAKVGTNPFYEQASVYAEILPLQLRVHVISDTTPATAGTVVGFIANAVPDARPVKQLAVASGPGLADVICTADAFCDALAMTADSVTFTASVNGRPKSVTVYLDVTPCAMSYGGIQTAACSDPDRWDVFLNSLTAAQRAAVLGLSARDRSACRQDLVACRRWLDEGGGFPTPSDSATYAEIAALTDSVYNELQWMSANWDGDLTAIQADPWATKVRSGASLVTPTPDNILDLLVVLYDLGEIAVAGPNAERLRGLALDAAATLVPGLPAPRLLAAGGKVARATARNLKAWHAAAAVGRTQHTILSQQLRAAGHIGAARVTLATGGIGYIDGAIIDATNKVITIIELKPSTAAAGPMGLRQLVDYKSALQSMETWVTHNRVIPIRDMLLNQGWRIETSLQRY